MKRLIPYVLCGLLLGGCARHRIIPDDELALIFHDAFLTNAYLNTENVRPDSLRLYEPIFAHYGYTTEDVHYTIGNFSKRKSARLGDVVEEAIDLLEAEGIGLIVLAGFLRILSADFTRRWAGRIINIHPSLIPSFCGAGFYGLRIDVEPGSYEVSLKYRIDSLDRNPRGLRSSMWLERRDSTRSNAYTTTLRRNREESFSRRFTADSTHRRLHIHLLTFGEAPQRPSITVRDLKVEFTPPTRDAVELLYEKQLNIRIFADEFFRGALSPQDSL